MIRRFAARPVHRILLIAILAFALSATGLALAPRGHSHDSVSAASQASRATFHDAMRQLWEDHIVWTRMAIVSIVADLPDASVAVDRLLRNQGDIGNAIRPFYGDAAADELTRLLHEHIAGAADILNAAKAGNAGAVETARVAWYANGAEIAGFLADANPRNWERGEMEEMMRDHLDLTLAEALARLEGRYADDAAAYDEIHAQILHMADMLSDGIIAQFPSQFSR